MSRFPDRISSSAEKEELTKSHAAALKREQDEVAMLRTQLAEISESHKIEMEQAATEKTGLEEEMEKLRNAAATAEKEADSARLAAQQFQARIDAWPAEFQKVQENMSGKFLFLSYYFRVTFSESALTDTASLPCSKLP